MKVICISVVSLFKENLDKNDMVSGWETTPSTFFLISCVHIYNIDFRESIIFLNSYVKIYGTYELYLYYSYKAYLFIHEVSILIVNDKCNDELSKRKKCN